MKIIGLIIILWFSIPNSLMRFGISTGLWIWNVYSENKSGWKKLSA